MGMSTCTVVFGQNPCRAMGLCFKLLPVTMLAAAKKLGSRGAPFFLGPGSDGSAAAKKLGYDWGPFIWWAAAKKLGLPLGSLHVSFFLGFWVGWVGRDQEAGLALGSLHIAVLGSWVGWVGHSHVEFHSCFLLSGSWLGWVGRGKQAGLPLGSLHISFLGYCSATVCTRGQTSCV